MFGAPLLLLHCIEPLARDKRFSSFSAWHQRTVFRIRGTTVNKGRASCNKRSELLLRTLELRGRMLCVAMQSSYSSGRMDCFACLCNAHFSLASREAKRDLHLSCQLLFLPARQVYAVALWLRVCGTGRKSGDSQMRLDLGSTRGLNPVVLVG